MDTMQTGMLQLMQAVAARPAAPSAPAAKSSGEKNDFRRLMERQTANGTQQETAPKAETPEEGRTEEVLQDPKLREQMMLAAAAMLQNPVVTQVQDPVVTEEVTAQPEAQPVVELAAQTEETPAQPETLAQTVLPKVNAEGTMTVREGPAEQTAEPVEAPAAETEQPVEAAQAPERSAEERPEDEQENGLESGGETAVFQDVREVPVKVGEPAAAEQSAEAQPVETQVAGKLTEALKSGETRVEIQLAPENLGKVTVEVTVHQDGTLHVALHAENSQTRGLLERDLTGLQSLLTRNTQQEVQVEVSRQQESQRQNFYDGHQGQEHQNPQQHRNRQSRERAEDFLHQLRLGLIPAEGE